MKFFRIIRSNKICMILCAICIFLSVSVTPVIKMEVRADVNKKIVKMLKGKWDTDGVQGIENYERYCIFTKKYQKWYVNGKLTNKNRIVRIERKSNKKYVLKMKGKNTKFRYIAYVKGKKFYAMEYWFGWSGKKMLSGSGSLHRI